MNFSQYQTEAMSFRLKSADDIYALLNLAGEVGELLSHEAKLRRDGADINEHLENVKKELGDILWCITAIAADNLLTLEEVAQANINKLTSRKARNTIQGYGDDR
jgi:NTP pyrophosphatase (non-canonical NTP hydrolase)